MSGEDAPRPYPEDLIVPEIKTNKQSTGTHDAAADSGHCSVRYLRPEDELPPDLLWTQRAGWRAVGVLPLSLGDVAQHSAIVSIILGLCAVLDWQHACKHWE